MTKNFSFSIRLSCCRPLPSVAMLVFFFLPVHPAQAQSPAAGAGTPASSGPGSSAPASTGPAPGVSSGIPRTVPNRPLSLSDVVNIAVGSNSGLVLAQQRLQQARELIVQVNAQGRPQFSADAVDVYSSYRAFPPTLTNSVITNPVLPGGGQIPQVVDSGTGFSTAFIFRRLERDSVFQRQSQQCHDPRH
jgi:outer membrane protein TolC